MTVEHWTTDNGLPLNSVVAICQSPEGYLWIATLDGLVRFDGVRLASFNRSNSAGIGGNRFTGMLCGPDGAFWAASDGSGNTEYRNGRFQTYTVRDGLLSNTSDGLLGDVRGNPWVLAHGCISRWDPSTMRFVPVEMQGDVAAGFPARGGQAVWFYWVNESGIDMFIRGERLHYSLPAGWRSSDLLLAGMDSERQVWVGSRTGKMARLTDGHWVISSAEQSQGASNEHASFRSNYRDSLGNTWTTQNEWDAAGIFKQQMVLPGDNPGRIAFTSLFEDREGSIWLTTDGDGLYRLRRQIIQVYSKGEGLPDGNTYGVYRSKDGAIWIGTWSGGLTRFANGKFTTYTTANGLASNRVLSIGEDAEGALWVSVEHGLHRMRNGRFERVGTEDLGGPDLEIRAIHADREGVFWLGSSQGLLQYEHGHWTALTRKDGLATEDIRVLIDSGGAGMWAGGYGGLSLLRKGQVRAWTEKDGLPSNIIRALYEDSSGVLWIGTYDGGLGWLPTQDGVAIIDPEHLPAVPGAPPVVMEACLIDHRPVAIDRPVRVTPGQQNREIQYTAPSLINSEHIRFKYQLEGLDREWVAAGTRRAAYYPQLRPGRYTFRVTAAHGGGIWNATGASLSIIVLPSFYQTWWFAFLLALTATACIWLAWRHRVLQLDRARTAQQVFARQLIDSQESERKRIAAGLHDSLGQRLVIINNRLLLFSRARDGMPALSGTQREHLEQICLEVSESMREVKEISYDLRPYRLDRLGLTKALRAMIDTAGDSGCTRFFAEIDDVDGVLPQKDEINFYRVVQECVNNILKHSEAEQATITIHRNAGAVALIARDNGRGFTPGRTKTSRFDGFGLTGIFERAQLLGGNAVIESTPGRGTTVTVQINLRS